MRAVAIPNIVGADFFLMGNHCCGPATGSRRLGGLIMCQSRLDQISTHSVLETTRYAGPVRAYAGVLLRPDEHAADDVSQEILCELQRGGISLRYLRIPPPRLPFRFVLRGIVYWAVQQYRRQQLQERARFVYHLKLEEIPDDDPPPHPEAEAKWVELSERRNAESRTRILRAAMARLEQYEESHERQAPFTLAQLRSDYPHAKAHELTDRLLERTGQVMRVDRLWVCLDRMRARLAEFIMQEVRPHLPPHLVDELLNRESCEQELKDLRLLGFFRSAEPGEGS
jgi:hypothetical protein